MNNFSPNMLKTFADCPKKYFFRYVQKISVPQKSSLFEKGKKIHALAHYYLRKDEISKLEISLNSDETAVWNILKSNEYFMKDYVNSEYNISAKVNDYWIGGRLDALMKSGDDYFILDYKTGSIPKNPENDFQTMVYLLCAERILKDCKSVKFVYINLKNNTNHVIDFDEEIKKKYEKSIVEICGKIISAKHFPQEYSQDSPICEFCEYKKICM